MRFFLRTAGSRRDPRAAPGGSHPSSRCALTMCRSSIGYLARQLPSVWYETPSDLAASTVLPPADFTAATISAIAVGRNLASRSLAEIIAPETVEIMGYNTKQCAIRPADAQLLLGARKLQAFRELERYGTA